MIIGVPKEIKQDEYRVGLIPPTAAELTARGHEVLVEAGAGIGSGIEDGAYVAAGARIAKTADEVFAQSELIVKVKEPLAAERRWLRPGLTLFTYLHLAADRAQTQELIESGVTAIGYETVTDAEGRLPLLTPMSKIAGRMAPQVAAHLLQRPNGGRGVLLADIEGAAPAKVVVLGAGTVGQAAMEMAADMGAEVTVVLHRAVAPGSHYPPLGRSIHAITGSSETIKALCTAADVVIAAALVAGAAAPKLIPAEVVASMKPGAVIVDVSIDQGGCAETSRPTMHSHPTFVVDGVIHYCVANMPGAVPRTSTFALSHATAPFVLALAEKGVRRALAEDVHFRNGLNVHAGKVTCRAVAEALGLPFTPAAEAL